MTDIPHAPGSVHDQDMPQRLQEVIAARLDALPVGRWHRRVLAVVALGAFFNFFEIALGSLLVPLLPAGWTVTTTDKALLIGATFAGEFVGALLLSGLADRYGRRTMFQLNLIAYAVFSIGAAFAQDATSLIALRFLLGIGLGAELILVDSYLTEMMPSARRGHLLATAYALGMTAIPVAGVLATTFPQAPSGLAGWRWLMLFTALGAVVAWLVRRNLPESPRWLAVHRPQQALDVMTRIERETGHSPAPGGDTLIALEVSATASSPTEARPRLWSPALRSRTTLVCVMQLLGPIGIYGFASIAPLVLIEKGYTVVDSLAYTAIGALGYPLGCYVLMHLTERIQRRTLVVASALGIAVTGIVFGAGTSVWVILPAGLLMSLVSVVNATVSRTYSAELFPTGIRNTALGRTYALSRLVAAVLPFCTLGILDALGPTLLFVCCAALITTMGITVAALGPRTNAVRLDTV
ncbi:MFS transporter [Streptomyces sp. NPDC005820]|uniref:MFS transporter n=1 Tax=Streptomyces sp. NPDC005820 TaxID=3157069 RepID=UPI0034110EED